MDKRILVIGGTRGTGLLLVRRLIDSGYGVRALVRNDARAEQIRDPRIERIVGDITQPDTLRRLFDGVDHAFFTAGVTKRPAGEALIRATEFDGVTHTLAAASDAGFRGRFLYMTSMGVNRPSAAATLLNLVKRRTLVWRKRAEDEIRASGLPYTIVRAGFLLNAAAGTRQVVVAQRDEPLALRYRIARGDVAATLLHALAHPKTVAATFDVAWGRGPVQPWHELFETLTADAAPRVAEGRR